MKLKEMEKHIKENGEIDWENNRVEVLEVIRQNPKIWNSTCVKKDIQLDYELYLSYRIETIETYYF